MEALAGVSRDEDGDGGGRGLAEGGVAEVGEDGATDVAGDTRQQNAGGGTMEQRSWWERKGVCERRG